MRLKEPRGSVLWWAGASLLGMAGCCSMFDSSGSGEPPGGESVSLAACASAASFPGVSSPERPVSLAEGAEALPPWIDGPTQVAVGGRRKGLPQVEGAKALFAGLAPVATERLDGGLVACRVESTEAVGEDRFLHVAVQIAGLPEVTHQGKEAETDVAFTIPGVALSKGQAVTVRAAVVDKACRVGVLTWWLPLPVPSCTEVTRSSATASQPFAGTFPITLSPRGFRAECRAMAREGVEAELAKRLRSADVAFPRLCSAVRIQPDHRAWGWPQSSAAARERREVDDTALLAAAGLVTWADPRVKGRVARYEQIRTEWEGALGRWVEKEATRRPRGAEGVVRAGEVSVSMPEGIACDAAASTRYRTERPPAGMVACFVRLVVKNLRDHAMEIERAASKEGDGAWLGKLAWRQVDVAFSTGHIAEARFVAFVEGGPPKSEVTRVSVAPGGTAELVLGAAVREAEARGSGAAIVRLHHDDAKFTEAATLLTAR